MDPAEFWSVYGVACLKSGAGDDAKIAYRRLAEYPDRGYEAVMNLGVVFFAEKAYDKAEVCFHKALEFRPGDANARKNLEQISRNSQKKGKE